MTTQQWHCWWLGLIGVLLSVNTYSAEELAIGIGAGDPTGLNAKSWQGGNAWQLGAGWDTEDGKDRVQLHLDFLHHDFTVLSVEQGRLPVYYGLGARFRDDHRTRLGLRIPIGVDYLVDRATLPASLFAEVAPRLYLTPKTQSGIDVVIGIRYRFRR